MAELLEGTSSLNLNRLVTWQAGHGWLIFYAPLSFIIFLAAMFAETNRMPFDLPESEQELAGGYNVEYSSMKFALFFMGEYANMTAAAAHDGDVVPGRLDAARSPAWTSPPRRSGSACCTSASSWRRCCS